MLGGRDADSEGLIGSVELRAADSFVSGMTEAAYVQCTPPPSILVPSISRDQEEDNTTFIGLEADHDPAEEVCLGSKETLPSPFWLEAAQLENRTFLPPSDLHLH